MAGSHRSDSNLPSDRELIARVLAGEEDSYRVLVERHADFVHAIVFRIVMDEDDAADVAQETFIRAHKALARFRGDSKFSSWLYRIAVNRALTHLKRRKRRPVAIDLSRARHIEARASVAASRGNPEQLVLEEEFRSRVREAVGQLPPRYRVVVTLFYLEEKSYKEVAAVLGIPMGTLKTHLHRARAMLRDILEEHELRNGRGA